MLEAVLVGLGVGVAAEMLMFVTVRVLTEGLTIGLAKTDGTGLPGLVDGVRV